MLLKPSWYILKSECYNFRLLNIISIKITKILATEYTEKEMRKEFKHFTTKELKDKKML